MRNFEKYKTVKERTEAFEAFCDSHGSRCDGCPLINACDDDSSAFAWLELEAEDEKPLPCPFCGSDDIRVRKSGDMYFVRCEKCLATSGDYSHESDAIAAHNRVARAVMAAKEKEAK